MKVYAVDIYYGIVYEGYSIETLGVFDSKEKAEKVKIEYENSEDYQTNSTLWDNYYIHIAEYEIKTLTRKFD